MEKLNSEYTKHFAETAIDFGFVPILLRGKIPLRKGWTNTTLQEAKEIFSKIKSFHNIGILTGIPSGIIVIDVEKAELPEWNELLEEHKKLKETFTVKTGGGGLHLYFSLDDLEMIRNGVKIKIPLENKKFSKFDVRTTGGQVVFIGSIHPETGKVYKPIKGFTEKDGEIETITIQKMPKWLSSNIIQAQKK